MAAYNDLADLVALETITATKSEGFIAHDVT